MCAFEALERFKEGILRARNREQSLQRAGVVRRDVDDGLPAVHGAAREIDLVHVQGRVAGHPTRARRVDVEPHQRHAERDAIFKRPCVAHRSSSG